MKVTVSLIDDNKKVISTLQHTVEDGNEVFERLVKDLLKDPMEDLRSLVERVSPSMLSTEGEDTPVNHVVDPRRLRGSSLDEMPDLSDIKAMDYDCSGHITSFKTPAEQPAMEYFRKPKRPQSEFIHDGRRKLIFIKCKKCGNLITNLSSEVEFDVTCRECGETTHINMDAEDTLYTKVLCSKCGSSSDFYRIGDIEDGIHCHHCRAPLNFEYDPAKGYWVELGSTVKDRSTHF